MPYIQGFVLPVPTAKKEAFRAMAAKAAPFFLEHGATRVVECWGEDVPDGKVTDFKMAVKATDVVSGIVWPDKANCGAAADRIQSDERMRPEGEMPFDGKRRIFGGFATILDAAG